MILYVIVTVELLLSSSFVEISLVSKFGGSISALNQIIFQSLGVKRLVQDIGHIHGFTELLLL